MPQLTRAVARLNKIGINRLTARLFPRLAGFGVVVHRGHRSGRTFRTPVNVFPTRHGYVIALTYGTEAQWVRNVLAAGGCELETRGQRLRLDAPRLFRDESRRDIRPVERAILGLAGIADFLELQPAASPASAAQPGGP